MEWEELTMDQQAIYSLVMDNPATCTDADIARYAPLSVALFCHGALEHAVYSACLDRVCGGEIRTITRTMINQARADTVRIMLIIERGK